MVQCLVDFKSWSFLQTHCFEVSTRHLPVAFAVMLEICRQKESARSSVISRSFGREVKRSGGILSGIGAPFDLIWRIARSRYDGKNGWQQALSAVGDLRTSVK